jgi:hypothetical protein
VQSSASSPGAVRRVWRRVLKTSAVSRSTLRHYVDAAIPWRQTFDALQAYPGYLRDRRAYGVLLHGERLMRSRDNPQLLDRTETTPFDPHYTHQDAWAAREVFRRRPDRHVDVGSRITFVVGLTAFTAVTFVDLRPLDVEVPGLEVVAGTVLGLPFEDRSVESLSCLHVAEHIGLGRYGDPLDPEGTRKAARELERVLAPGGALYFSLPVGEPRTEFNAHRVHDPDEIVSFFPELRLASFSGVSDEGRWHERLTPQDLAGSSWACGCYLFTRD